MDSALVQYKTIIDEEIQAYESLGDLYNVKQSILVQGKSDTLWDVDAQIIEKAASIKALNQKRKEVAKYIGDENLTLSQVIDKAKEANDSIASNLEDQRGRLRLLSNSLVLQESTNMTLVKHGLTMVGRTIDVIMSSVIPQSNQYDKQGKNIESDKSMISSVVEEA